MIDEVIFMVSDNDPLGVWEAFGDLVVGLLPLTILVMGIGCTLLLIEFILWQRRLWKNKKAGDK